jgi:hypothetical protein
MEIVMHKHNIIENLSAMLYSRAKKHALLKTSIK